MLQGGMLSQSMLNQSFQSMSSRAPSQVGYGQLSGVGMMNYNQIEQRLAQNMYPRLSAARMNPLIRKDSIARESEFSKFDEESQFERMMTERVQN